MSQRRNPDEEKSTPESSCPDNDRRGVPAMKNVVLDFMRLHSVQHLLEPIIRKVVREEVELALRKHLTSMKQNKENTVEDMDLSESRCLRLKFVNNLSLPVFTGSRIEGVDRSALKVIMVDATSGKYVTSGPESLAKVEIVVLEGDFDGDEGDNWTSEEFKNNVIKEREGKKPILTGDIFLNLKDGVGSIDDISFTDNSSWTRSRRFRLGARIVDSVDGISVREAKTESFVVRDHRGELYKKHHPPLLIDEVWRLEKIGKDGAFHRRLCRENIITVKDFLTLLFLDPQRLRNILGTGMSAKMWDITVEHARTCVMDNKKYLYRGVVFNVVGQVLGLLTDCQYVPIDKLSENEKIDATILVLSAFEHWGEVVSFGDEVLPEGESGESSRLVTGVCNSSSPTMEGCSGSVGFPSHLQRDGGFDYAQPSAFSPEITLPICSVGIGSGLDDFVLQSIDDLGLRFYQTSSFPNPVDSLIGNSEPLDQVFYRDDHLRFFESDLHHNFNSQIMEEVHPWQRARIRWRKLFSVLKWFSIRRLVSKRLRLPENKRHRIEFREVD